MWRRAKIEAPILCEFREGDSHPLRSCEDTTKIVLCVLITFSHFEVTTGVRLELKAQFYPHRPVRTVVMQESLSSKSITNVDMKTVPLHKDRRLEVHT